ncbi:MAG TPA: hypothetical protein PK095_11665, partial [Myxococcota bacterium]|nr:hypothetical protein [Myxococcota bacterium]
FHLIPTMTALENVAIPLEFAGRSDAFGLAEAALKRVGLGHRVFVGAGLGHADARLARAAGDGRDLPRGLGAPLEARRLNAMTPRD